LCVKPRWCSYIQAYCYIPEVVETEGGRAEICCLTSRRCCLFCLEPCEPLKRYIELTRRQLAEKG